MDGLKNGYQELLESGNLAIADMAMKCEAVFHDHERALVSISGGSDSDVMMDVCERVRQVQPIHIDYVWFDTGIEYRATKNHLAYLRERYGVEIIQRRAMKTIPVSCKEYGQPFLSKYVSTIMGRLQSIGFDWSDEPYEELLERYDGRQVSALKWWCNKWTRVEGEAGWFDIGRYPYLKEFIIENPPTFKISAKCCDYAKKRVSRAVERERESDLVLTGVRRAEGGVRAAHKSCFDRGGHGTDTYRPLFWLSNSDKSEYDEKFGIIHSECYRTWGFARTGCAGCPFGRRRTEELEVLEKYEPSIAKACRKVFADSYEYTRQFHEFREEMRARESGQMRLSFD